MFADLADAQFVNQRNSQAIDTSKLFINTYPDSSYAHSSLGNGYMRIKQFQLAKENFEAAINLVQQKGLTDPSIIDYLQSRAAAANSNI